MKILHIIPTLGSGGAESMLVNLVKGIRDSGIDCDIAVLSNTNLFFLDKVNSFNIPIYISKEKSCYSLKNIFFIKKLILKKKYDLIHTHLFSAQLFTPIAIMLLPKNYKVNLVTTEHSTHNKRRDNKLFYILDKIMYSKYKEIIAISPSTKDNLSNYLPETKRKTKVIHNGVNLKEFKGASSLLKSEIDIRLNENDILILMVAGMREQKDPETLIRASEYLPENYKIIFVGDGGRMDEVQKYAGNYRKESIFFVGKRGDVAKIMKTSNVFVLSSRWEGFGLVIVEAAATGLPIVASNVEGLSGVVNSLGGKLFESFNERDLAKKIIDSVNSKSEAYNIEKYDIDITVEEYIDSYRNMYD